MPEKATLTSSELGSLWLTYQEKTLILRMLEYFIEKADDEQAKKMMTDVYNDLDPYVEKIMEIFQNEGAAIPVGYTAEDVNTGVPKLYDHGFDIMFVRLIQEISMAMHTIHMTMAYREDIVMFYKELTAITQAYYHTSTQYLIQKGLLARPPYTSMPTSVEFVKDTNYMGAYHLFNDTRAFNSVEVGHLYRGIETNVLGMQLIVGFAQCAHEPEVKKYFVKGKDLAERIVADFSKALLDSDIQPPATSGGHATRSTVAPFSDKLMMYCSNLLSSFALGSNGLGAAFSLRNDLPLKMATYSKSVYDYASEGGKIMINNGWMEQPPQMEDRKQLVK